jgi:hypothetical protein
MRGGKEKRKARCDYSSAKGEISSEKVVELIRRRRRSYQRKLRYLQGEEGRVLLREGKGKLEGG